MKTYPIYQDRFWLNGRWWPFAQWAHPSQSRILFSQDDVDVWKRYVSAGDLVLDIGAYTGDTAFPFIVNGCSVYAMEPNPKSFEVLMANAVNWNNLIPYKRALMPLAGSYEFGYSDADLCNGGLDALGHNHVLKVEAISPDMLPKWDWDFIKIDAETQDMNILRAMEPIITRCKPVIRCEVYPSLTMKDRMDYTRLINDLGYKCEGHEEDLLPFLTAIEGQVSDLILLPK